jgi:hypothetical protein
MRCFRDVQNCACQVPMSLSQPASAVLQSATQVPESNSQELLENPLCVCFRVQCGCQCTRCCFNGDPSNCTSITQGTCPYECLQHNKSHCGVAFSTPSQYPFCDLDHTSSWPAILQVKLQQCVSKHILQTCGLLHACVCMPSR